MKSLLLGGLLLSGVFLVSPGRDVNAQTSTSSTGSLIVKVTSGSNVFTEGLSVSYTQVSHDFLTGYAVSLRYPDYFYMPEADEAREALAAAQEVRAFVTARMA